MATYFTKLEGIVAEVAEKVIDAADVDRLAIFTATAADLYIGFTEAEAEAAAIGTGTGGLTAPVELVIPGGQELWVYSPNANGIRLLVTKANTGC